MASEHSFDITAEVDLVEMQNAHQLALKQIANRYDFKGRTTILELNREEKTVVAEGSDEYTVTAMMDIFTTCLAKRGVDLKALAETGKEVAPGGNVRRRYQIRDSLRQEDAKKITKAIKESKLKVQASIQGDAVRVKGTSRDILQDVQKLVRELGLECPVSFGNYR